MIPWYLRYVNESGVNSCPRLMSIVRVSSGDRCLSVQSLAGNRRCDGDVVCAFSDRYTVTPAVVLARGHLYVDSFGILPELTLPSSQPKRFTGMFQRL